jgi:Zn-dependent protease
MDELNLLQKLIIWVPPVLLAITLHEVAHGWIALRCGDTTARDQHRLSLNPLRHVDPVGTVLVPAMLFFVSALSGGHGIIFGWAKPVPVDFRRLRSPKRDMALVAIAGPAANLLMALLWAATLTLGAWLYPVFPQVGMPLAYMGFAGIAVNVVLGALNMLPVPPLDGSRVLAGLLPSAVGRFMAQVEPFGLVILLLLLVTGTLGVILGPMVGWLADLILALFGITAEIR